ncbi:MAG TPA: 4Fe-4S binding protein [Rhodocyclaceae bacterium]|nr:4Fe-4S binding protein [Rhodocyclaceae bacterium]
MLRKSTSPRWGEVGRKGRSFQSRSICQDPSRQESMNAPVGELLKQHLIDPEICIRCNTCEETCPVDAVTHDGNNYVVDAAICNHCMDCIPPCPTGSIDNWRVVNSPYTLEEQFSWSELPPQQETPAADGAAVPLARPQAEPAPGLRAKSRASGVDEGERSEKAAAPTQASREQAFRTPEDWINEIRALRRAGRDSEWRASLARFRERYPDYGIPSDLRN